MANGDERPGPALVPRFFKGIPATEGLAREPLRQQRVPTTLLVPRPTVLVAVRAGCVREGLVAMVGALDDFQVVADAATDQDALRLARLLRPCIALVDEDLPASGGTWTIETMRKEGLVRDIVALGWRGDDGTRTRALAAGASLYIQEGMDAEEIVRALRAFS